MVMARWSRPVAWMRATPLTSRGVAKQITAARLRWLRARPPSEELEQIVGQADQRPLRSDLVVAAEEEAPKGPALLGLAKDRLDDRLAACVDPPALRRAPPSAPPPPARPPRPPGPPRGPAMPWAGPAPVTVH